KMDVWSDRDELFVRLEIVAARHRMIGGPGRNLQIVIAEIQPMERPRRSARRQIQSEAGAIGLQLTHLRIVDLKPQLRASRNPFRRVLSEDVRLASGEKRRERTFAEALQNRNTGVVSARIIDDRRIVANKRQSVGDL